jgi:dTDP-glucose 4,6-dehydratase
MKPHALVAGGAGFIGSHLVDLLLEKNYSVTVIDNFVTGRKQNLEHIKNSIRLIELDINELPSAPFELTEPIDEIYNLASPASPVDFSKMPSFILQTAAVGHRNLLQLALKKKSSILFASTSEVYGDPLQHPQTEAYFGNVNPIGLRGCYDEAKRFGEALTMAYHRQFGVKTRIARIFNTYGERMRPDDGRIIPNFFVQALQGQTLSVYGDGKQTRSFCYVRDLVEGLYLLMQSSELRPVNIGNPLEKQVVEMALIIQKLAGHQTEVAHLPLSENDPLQRKPDISRAAEVLGWKPKVSLEEGLQKTLLYFKSEIENSRLVGNGLIKTPLLAGSGDSKLSNS